MIRTSRQRRRFNALKSQTQHNAFSLGKFFGRNAGLTDEVIHKRCNSEQNEAKKIVTLRRKRVNESNKIEISIQQIINKAAIITA
jgi:hypothetical protein